MTRVLLVSEENPGPDHQGRKHLQAEIGSPTRLDDALRESFAKITIDYPGVLHRRAGYRLEEVPDGAGVLHYNLYVYYDPVGADVVRLDPHNLNGAEQAVFGQVLTPDDPTVDVGRMERRF